MDPSQNIPDDLAEDCKTPKPRRKPQLAISPARLEANRRNAQKSTGPRTAEGKAASRQNALKHGLTGQGVVVHPEDAERLRTRLADWTRDLDPRDTVESWLVERAALASVRLDRCALREQAHLTVRLEQVSEDWLETEYALAEKCALGLDAKPAATLHVLKQYAAGCEWLQHAWEQLAQSLQTRGRLARAECDRLLRLLGEAKPPTASTPGKTAGLWAAALALLAPEELDPTEVDRFRGTSTARLGRPERLAEVRKLLPAPDAARTTLLAFLHAECDRLAQRAQVLWTDSDGPVLQRARHLAFFDSSDEAQRMLRYERANTAEVHRCLNLLSKKRHDEARLGLARPRTENQPTASATQTTVMASATSGQARPVAPEPFAMPRPLTERLGAVTEPRGASNPAAEPPSEQAAALVPPAPAVSDPVPSLYGQPPGGLSAPAPELAAAG